MSSALGRRRRFKCGCCEKPRNFRSTSARDQHMLDNRERIQAAELSHSRFRLQIEKLCGRLNAIQQLSTAE